MVDAGFATPEEAALSSYSPAARAFVAEVKYVSEREVIVTVDTDPHYPYFIQVLRFEDGWHEGSDHN